MTRQAVAARQIEAAMKLRGLSKKQFAELMHRSPSEVTKWLSGKHNFTISLLQEISRIVGAEITGVEDVARLVDGYSNVTEDVPESENALRDPASGVMAMDHNLALMIRQRSLELGLTALSYLRKLVEDDIRKSAFLPKVDLSSEPGEETKKYSGIVPYHEIVGDERFDRIWNG
ncbi:MAG: helix-turn-helix domain-containing protein [Candidatus Cryptobacteroides sp.]